MLNNHPWMPLWNHKIRCHSRTAEIRSRASYLMTAESEIDRIIIMVDRCRRISQQEILLAKLNNSKSKIHPNLIPLTNYQDPSFNPTINPFNSIALIIRDIWTKRIQVSIIKTVLRSIIPNPTNLVSINQKI